MTVAVGIDEAGERSAKGRVERAADRLGDGLTVVADVPRQAEELTTALEKVEGDIIVTAPGLDTAYRVISAALERLAGR
ncbi:MAG TPA: hypothetical protein VNF03_12565, partial [Patescibacteria group bacterium]|nr:hypothetical protein [Patescibacteria group bacterium]